MSFTIIDFGVKRDLHPGQLFLKSEIDVLRRESRFSSVVAMPLVPLSMDEHRDEEDRHVTKGNTRPHSTMLYRGKSSGRGSRFPKSEEKPIMRTSIARR